MQKFPKVFTIMSAILALTFCAVSCKTDDDDEPTMYTVTVSSSIEHGKVSVDKTSAEKGATVTLTLSASDGYEFGTLSVTGASNVEITTTAVTEGSKYTFTMPESNVTVSATFTALPPDTASYTVKHLQQNISDDDYTLNESETKTGTVGQSTDASAKSYEGFTAQSVTQATIAASGTVVEIKYDRKSYTVTFNANGGSTVTSQSVRYGATATKPADPTKTATASTKYTFEGWYSDSDLTTSFSFDTAITENITLYAKWTETAITPQKTAGSISYATTSVEKKTADEAFTNPLTNTGDGTVTYASSKTDVATVNASTGEVTIVGAGTATITATVADSDTYTYATKTASYTLTVTQSVTIPEGFVKVSGTTITGSETWTPSSSVFVSGRSLAIPDLYVCDHEVTRGEFKALMGTDPSTADAYDKDGNKLTGDDVLNNPVNYVNWYAAIAYCNKLSVKEGLDCAYTVSGITDWENLAYSDIPTSSDSTWNAATCDFEANGYRLPTEAEWEWLARGGKNYTYAGSNTVGDVAWYKSNTNDTGSRDVKTKAANDYGLYDMSGNVGEWCWDWYGSITSSTGASGASSDYRVQRGGSWRNDANYCRVAIRNYFYPSSRGSGYGFRLVRSAQ